MHVPIERLQGQPVKPIPTNQIHTQQSVVDAWPIVVYEMIFLNLAPVYVAQVIQKVLGSNPIWSTFSGHNTILVFQALSDRY